MLEILEKLKARKAERRMEKIEREIDANLLRRREESFYPRLSATQEGVITEEFFKEWIKKDIELRIAEAEKMRWLVEENKTLNTELEMMKYFGVVTNKEDQEKKKINIKGIYRKFRMLIYRNNPSRKVWLKKVKRENLYSLHLSEIDRKIIDSEIEYKRNQKGELEQK